MKKICTGTKINASGEFSPRFLLPEQVLHGSVKDLGRRETRMSMYFHDTYYAAMPL